MTLQSVKDENSTQPKVILFNAGLNELQKYCFQGFDNWRKSQNISDSFIESCPVFYRKNFRKLLDLIHSFFPSDLKIFRTTTAAWMKWGNFGFEWTPQYEQDTERSPHVVKIFNDIALTSIRESGYDVKVYDAFWMSYGRPDDTEIGMKNEAGGHMVHLGRSVLKVSIQKMITLVAEFFGCFA